MFKILFTKKPNHIFQFFPNDELKEIILVLNKSKRQPDYTKKTIKMRNVRR